MVLVLIVAILILGLTSLGVLAIAAALGNGAGRTGSARRVRPQPRSDASLSRA